MAIETIERDRPTYSLRSCMLSILLIFVGIFLCVSVVFVVADTSCRNNTAMWIPMYPDAEVVEERKTFLNTFGMGVTQVTLSTPDDPNTVRKWYLDTRAQNEANPTNLLATMRYLVREGENGGSTIILSSECAWN